MKPPTTPPGGDQTLLGADGKPPETGQQDEAKAAAAAAAEKAPRLTGMVRVKAVKSFWAGDTVLVEVGKSVDLPAAEAESRRDLEEVEIVQAEG